MTIQHAPIRSTDIAPIDDQPLLYQFCRIVMPGNKVLGEDMFRLVHFQGQDGVSELFEYQLELHGDSDPTGVSIDFSTIIGRPITVAIASTPFADGEVAHQAFLRAMDGEDPAARYAVFNGIVAGFAIDMPGVYRIVMRPAAWRMSLTNRYRIFTQKSVTQVLMQLCRDHAVDASFEGLLGPQNLASARVQDWLQAGETDLDILRRLLGKAHIYYYFRHAAGRHVMVFDNRPVYPEAMPGDAPLYYTYTSTDALGRHEGDVVPQYSYQQQMGITGVGGVFTSQIDAWDVDQPSRPLADWADFRGESRDDIGALPFHQYKIVAYGFSDDQVREFARATELAMHTANLQLEGASQCPLLRVGHRFTLKTLGQYVRPELDGKEFVVTHLQHDANLDGDYRNQFSATPSAGLIAQVGIQDTQQGTVLARVCTPAGDGTVRHWPYYIPDDFSLGRQWMEDRLSTVQPRLNAKGVYVRFSTDDDSVDPVWVKLAAHMQTIPEVGCTVWVTRGNDESETPEIQNIVQADGTRTVTDTTWTAHSSVGNSYSTSYGDNRSVRFGQPWSPGDVDNAVRLVETAYARGAFRDASYSRGGSYGYSESEQHEQGMLSESYSYGSTYSNFWGKESKSFSATGRSYHESVTGDCDPALASTEADDADAKAAVSAVRSLVIGDSYSNSTNRGDTKSVALYDGDLSSETTHTGKIDTKTTVEGTTRNESTHKAKVTSVNEIYADSDNTSKVTGTSTNRSTHHIVHNITTIDAQSSSTAIGASNSNDAVGVSNSNSATGVSNRNSVLGANIDLSLQGATNAVSLTGIHNGATVTGMSNTVSVVGQSNTVEVVGSSTKVEIAGPGATFSMKSDQAKIDLDGPVMQIPVIVLVL